MSTTPPPPRPADADEAVGVILVQFAKLRMARCTQLGTLYTHPLWSVMQGKSAEYFNAINPDALLARKGDGK